VASKLIVRKIYFKNNDRNIAGFGFTLPKKLMSSDKNGDDMAYDMNLGLMFAIVWSIIKVYDALKKYNSIRYTVSITRIISRFTGFICSLYIPYPLRYVMYGGFAKIYGINMEECEHPDFGYYATFTEFFTRHLKDGVRTIKNPKDGRTMCSPCDGKVLTCGKINSEFSTIDCVKGRSYRLDEFMFGV